MRCTRCGTELHPQDRFCAECGMRTPTEAERFTWAAREMSQLAARRRAGELDDVAFGKARNELMIQDDRGHYWMPNQDGTWLCYEGTAWVVRDPPVSLKPARAPTAVRSAPRRAPPPTPKKGKRKRGLIASVAIVLLALLVVAAMCEVWPLLDQSRRATRISSYPTTTSPTYSASTAIKVTSTAQTGPAAAPTSAGPSTAPTQAGELEPAEIVDQREVSFTLEEQGFRLES